MRVAAYGERASLLAVRFADQARQESTLAGTAVHCGSRDARLERLALRVRGKTPPSRTAIGIEFWRETPVDQVLTRKQA